jgi:peptidoglycan hydrolase-like protein with peptidoglycan-binding domain
MPSAASPLSVATVAPVSGSTGVSGTSPLVVTLSAPIAKSSAMPVLSPATAGAWQSSGAVLTFTPSVPFTPLSRVTLTIPAGSSGVVGASGGQLAQPVVDQFRIADGSLLRLQQLLSLLDYSPLTWTPSAPAIAPTDTAAQMTAIYTPPAGTFSWTNPGWPTRLRALWELGVANVFTRGLIMSFQADHGLAPTGHIAASLWTALVDALGANTLNTGGYNWALANKAAPESLTIYHDGRVVLTSPANTGIASSPTPDGTFAVNTRLRRQVMHGTNPNGQPYADLVQYIAYFHGNDAVHYMDRADYGIPQSLGCVELPLADAARVWPYLAYGTLVSIIN